MKNSKQAFDYNEAGFSFNISAIEVKFDGCDRRSGHVFINGLLVGTLTGNRFAPKQKKYMTWACYYRPPEDPRNKISYDLVNNGTLHECLASIIWNLAIAFTTVAVETRDFIGFGWYGKRDDVPFTWDIGTFFKPDLNATIIDHRDGEISEPLDDEF